MRDTIVDQPTKILITDLIGNQIEIEKATTRIEENAATAFEKGTATVLLILDKQDRSFIKKFDHFLSYFFTFNFSKLGIIDQENSRIFFCFIPPKSLKAVRIQKALTEQVNDIALKNRYQKTPPFKSVVFKMHNNWKLQFKRFFCYYGIMPSKPK